MFGWGLTNSDPDQPFGQLAIVDPRKRRVQIDRAQVLVRQEICTTVGSQFIDKCRGCIVRIEEPDDRFRLLAEIGVEHANHRSIGDAGVGDQLVLDFLRVDAHSAGDDRVALAIGQGQVTVLVEIADIAQGRPCRVERIADVAGLVGSAQVLKIPAPS